MSSYKKYEKTDIELNIKSLRNKFDFLTHFQPMFHCYTPWKHQKAGGETFIEVEHWLKMGFNLSN